MPTDAHRAEASRQGVDCDGQAERFRDWCTSNAKRFADFDAAFRNWLRRAREMGGNTPPRLPPRAAASNATFDSVRRKAEEARAQEAAEEAQRERLLT
jgi:uncharacterized protein with von Willebrand factor type A (vWA) domain